MTTKNNLLLEKAIKKAMPAGGMALVMLCISMMTDYILAGVFFTPTHIACIGIASPITLLCYSLSAVIGTGAVINLIHSIGRNDKEACNRFYSMILPLWYRSGCFLW